jgi:thiamine-monophosphate kinase
MAAKQRPKRGGWNGEFEIIARLTANLPAGEGVVVGPGDDAAIVRPTRGLDLVLTTDTLVDGRHFRSKWFGDSALGRRMPAAIGARLAAANLSDIAAMAARPRWAMFSAGIGERQAPWLEAVQRATAHALARSGASLVGGNLSRVSGAPWLTLALAGEVEAGRSWTRRGARPGDLLAVTGTPGLAAAFLLLAARGRHTLAAAGDALVETWMNPPSRIAAAQAMAASGAVTAAIDISDGLVGDLAHLCRASAVGAELDAAALENDDALIAAAARLLPRARARGTGRRTASSVKLVRLVRELRLAPGDDYELLLAVDPRQRERCAEVSAAAGAPLTFIGRVTSRSDERWLKLKDGSRVPLGGRGYDHFARGR